MKGDENNLPTIQKCFMRKCCENFSLDYPVLKCYFVSDRRKVCVDRKYYYTLHDILLY